ncbi:MAG: BLUF domain-containing protein [Pseudomonadota bacterium]
MSSPVTPPAPPDLQTLVYMSTATRNPTRGELDHLLEKAQMRNEQHGVTGVLLYSEGSFIQCIEGAADALDLVYGFILADPLHQHIFEVLREPIEERLFGDWSMAVRATAASGLGMPRQDDSLARMLADPPPTHAPSLLLLQAFWNRGLGSRYARAIAN